jgi:hypothetical protein
MSEQRATVRFDQSPELRFVHHGTRRDAPRSPGRCDPVVQVQRHS